jgi:uncharacterized protein with ParB-like and HNH nuclease domain
MQVNNFNIARVFSNGGNIFYFLPHFQREYAWDKENWKSLLEDIYNICATTTNQQKTDHFLGSLVVINDGNRDGIIPAFKLVDGQQRLTTISLMLCALHELVKNERPEIATNIRPLLINQYATGSSYFKIWPTKKYGDRDSYSALIHNGSIIDDSKSRIPDAYSFFHKELGHKLRKHEIDPAHLFIAITNQLYVVFIDLDNRERPYEIFESLNAKGKPLTQPDLVRNYVAMRLPETTQEVVFDKYWSKIEELLREERSVGRSRLGEITGFLRHYLAIRAGALPSQNSVYIRFRDRMEKAFPEHDQFVAEISQLKRFAEYYNKLLRPEAESDEIIANRLTRLNILEVTTAYPFLMSMYDAWDNGSISREQFLTGLKDLENYIVRRYLTNEPTNYLNKMFPTLWRDIDHTQFTVSLRQLLVNRNYPSDSKVKIAVLTHEMYDKRIQSRQKVNLVLDSINRHLSKGSGGYTQLDANPTIEHIMPQTPGRAWKESLGLEWQDTYRDYLHTLGNLTLVTQEWNSSLSNSPFPDKKKKLENHALKLNSDYFSKYIPQWNKNTIQARAEFLAQQISEIWPALGEPPVPSNGTVRPQAVIILGETHPVNSWRDVAHKTAEVISHVTDDFDAIAEELPNYFSHTKFKHASRELSNGWWLYVNLSGDSTKSLCQRLLALANIPEEDWELEEG